MIQIQLFDFLTDMFFLIIMHNYFDNYNARNIMILDFSDLVNENVMFFAPCYNYSIILLNNSFFKLFYK